MDDGPALCTRCNILLSASAKYCHECGQAVLSPTGSLSQGKWYHHWLFVIFMLFFIAGPFGLPLVWKNPRFSRSVKWALTLATLVYTGFLIMLTMKLAQTLMHPFGSINESFQPF